MVFLVYYQDLTVFYAVEWMVSSQKIQNETVHHAEMKRRQKKRARSIGRSREASRMRVRVFTRV
jgi:hypothetical protein